MQTGKLKSVGQQRNIVPQQGPKNDLKEADYEKAIERLRRSVEQAKQTELRILLVGQTGVGKSSTINSLLGEEVAPTNRHEPGTITAETYEKKVNGVPCRIIDTPGLCDTRLRAQADRKKLAQIKKEAGKFHAMLFVTRLDFHRVTSDEEYAIQQITATFGKAVWKRTVIVFTHARNVEPSHFDIDLEVRSNLIRGVVQQAGGTRTDAIPSVAVENKSKSAKTPDGRKWLPVLFLKVFSVIDKAGALPYVVATAKPKRPNDPTSGRRIEFDEEQTREYTKQVKEKMGPEGWLTLTYFGTAPIALVGGALFGPPGFVIGALGTIAVGLGGMAWSAFFGD